MDWSIQEDLQFQKECMRPDIKEQLRMNYYSCKGTVLYNCIQNDLSIYKSQMKVRRTWKYSEWGMF
jgi:hypothetical protein